MKRPTKRVLALVCMLAMLLSFAVPAMADDAFAVTAETVETPVAAGTTSVDVPLTLTANPGVACVNFQITYDTALTLTAITRGDALGTLTAKLEITSPLRTLARGYALCEDETGALVRRAAAVKPGRPLRVRFADGSAQCTVDAVEPESD